MAADPVEQITAALRAQQRPGETVEAGPSATLYLSSERFFVAKYNPQAQQATVTPFDNAAIHEVRVVAGRAYGDKKPGWFVEVGLEGRAATGLAAEGDDPAAEMAYSERPNVIYCGRGEEAEKVARNIQAVLEARKPTTVAADWYPDPQGVARLRYWDGAAWTTHTAD